jgi:hypothetical protein
MNAKRLGRTRWVAARDHSAKARPLTAHEVDRRLIPRHAGARGTRGWSYSTGLRGCADEGSLPADDDS